VGIATEPAAARRGIGRQSAADLILRTASRDRDAVALVFAGREWSYGALAGEAVSLAQGLRRLGAGAGDRIAYYGFNSDRYVVSWLATQLAGAIHVPINYMLGAGEVRYVLDHSGAAVAFADEELAPVLEQAAAGLETEPRLVTLQGRAPGEAWVSFEDALGGPELPHIPVGSGDVAQIAYTSGTESAPKGAMLSHEALVSQYTSCIVAGAYRPEDVVLHSLPLYHCAQLHCFLMPYLWLGARNVLLRKAGPGEMIAAVEQHGITSIFAPPTVWIALLRHPDFDPARLASLTKGYYGASIMPTEIVRELLQRLPGLQLWNYYGQTELCPLATCLQPEDQLRRPGSAGRPVLNVETRVVDEKLRPVAPGEVGEVVHRSPQVMLGYYRNDEKTAEAFAGGWFHSGDLATVDEDGYITIVDRKKDMINSGGENVSSREVEEVLYEHPAVSEVAVVAVPDPKWIEAVCAVVVPRAGSSVEADELVSFARERIAAFKVPKRIVFADALPKNPSGKILKRELRDQLAGAVHAAPAS
jgi:fatty-acyl-CoA synthase